MKKSYIIGVVLIGVAIAAIASMYGDASTYEDFATAQANSDKEFHIVGTLNKSKERYYDPKKDANFFSFYMIDEKGMESKVVYHHPEPTDFDRSEKIVIVGQMQEGYFDAEKILLKCPSKYTDNQVKGS